MPSPMFSRCARSLPCTTAIADDETQCPPRSLATNARLALRWGRQHCRQQRFQKAGVSFQAALHHYTQLQDAIGMGQSLNGLSAVYLQTAQYGRAQACSQAAMAILEETPARSDFALAVYQLGVSHLKQHHDAQAQQRLEQALALYHDLPGDLDEDRVLLHLGQLYAKRQEFMFALACYEAVLDGVLMRPLSENAEELLLTVLSLMMDLCEATGRGNGAIAPDQTVINRYITSGNPMQIALLFRRLGQFHESQGRYGLALECYTQALKAMPPEKLS